MPLLAQFFDELLPVVQSDLHTALAPPAGVPPLFYRMFHYHMGWVDRDGQPTAPEGGKCIRPVLCLLVCKSVCGDHAPARPAAAAVELIHNFSLLHDDIEDQSPLRRNRATAWSIWGEKQAINAGDALFALAHLAIPRLAPHGTNDGLVAHSLEIVDGASLELTRGQHLDIAFEDRDEVTAEDYLDMVRGKTATLIAAAAWLGALAGGADETVQAHYRAFGENLGMAFQVCDDMLDIWGAPEVIGKQAASDIYQRKKSLPVLYGLQHSPELRDFYANPQPFDDQVVGQVIDLLDGVGARQYAEGLAKQYTDQTLASLQSAAPGGDAGKALFELVHQLLHRER
jgi:geranylgeranyl diphosphate synthase type I